MKIWNVADGAEVAVLKIQAERVAFAPDGESWYGGNNGHVCQWAVPSDVCCARSMGIAAATAHRPFSRCSDHRDRRSAQRRSLGRQDRQTQTLLYRPRHGRLVAFFRQRRQGTADGGLRFARLSLGPGRPPARCMEASWELGLDNCGALADSKTLAIQNDQLRALLVDPLTGNVRQSFNNHQDKKWRHNSYFAMQFAFSPDSRRVLSAAGGVDRHVRLWEADTANEIWNVTTDKPETLIQGFALSPDGLTMYLTRRSWASQVYDVGKAPWQASGRSALRRR